jgi:hypothetical protein
LPKGKEVDGMVRIDDPLSKKLALGCLAHAIAVTAEWILEFVLDLDLVPGKIWLIAALLWPLWVVPFLLSSPTMTKRWVLFGGTGLLILTPTLSTIYTYSAWAIGGFAP